MTSKDYRFCGWGYLSLSVAGLGLSASGTTVDGSFIGAMFIASLLAFVASDILKALGK